MEGGGGLTAFLPPISSSPPPQGQAFNQRTQRVQSGQALDPPPGLEVGAGGLAGAEVSDPRGECDRHCSSLQPLSRDRLLPTRMTQGQFPWESAQAGSGYSSFPQRLSLQALSAHPSGVCHIPSSPWPELASES